MVFLSLQPKTCLEIVSETQASYVYVNNYRCSYNNLMLSVLTVFSLAQYFLTNHANS